MTDAAAPRFRLPFKRIAAALALGIAITVCGALAYPYDGWLAFPLFLAWAVFGISLILNAIRFAWQGRSMNRLVPLTATATGLVLCYLAMTFGFRMLGDRVVDRDFQVHKSEFDRVVQEVNQRNWGAGIHRVDFGETIRTVDASDAVRIELSGQGSFSNWRGFYYDPTDSYVTGRAHHFGGTVHGCRRVEGHYFYCSYDLENS